MCKKEISNKDLEKVCGGFSGSMYPASGALSVTQEEYDELEKSGFIVDGKLKYSDVCAAANHLKKKGFNGSLSTSCGHSFLVSDRSQEPEFALVTKQLSFKTGENKSKK